MLIFNCAQWIHGNQDLVAHYGERKWSWRPDFLVENDENGAEQFRICEINARFCWNGYMHQGYGQKGLETFDLESRGLAHATDSNAVRRMINSLFHQAVQGVDTCGNCRSSTHCWDYLTTTFPCIWSKERNVELTFSCLLSSLRNMVLKYVSLPPVTSG